MNPLLAPFLVLTDLDGTLLDHDDYSIDPARPALERLAAAGIPVVLASSKTRTELQTIARTLELNAPVIAENGAVLATSEPWPGHTAGLQRFSPPYPELVRQLQRLRERDRPRFSGFHELGIDQVARLTGLPRQQAAQACQREASEPILWQDDEDALRAFVRQLGASGLKLLRGGRFHHVLGADADKANAAMSLITALRTRGWKGRIIALGDAPNDHQLLAIADLPVIVHNAASPAMPPLPNPRLLRTRASGPAGWREAIDTLLGVCPT